PCYHGSDATSAEMEAQLAQALARGDELALHGYTHLDSAAAGGGLGERFLRGVYTPRVGEFAAIGQPEAQHRIQLGLDWFAERGWPVAGFVAPAWLLGKGAWQALMQFEFEYTTTFSRFHLLAGQGGALFAPSLVYAARNRGGRVLSPLAAGAAARLLAQRPLARLSLHPPDARHPALLRHAQQLVERLLVTRTALTKAGCARLLTRAGPSSPGHASNPHHSRCNTTDMARSAACLP
ncbi:MAG: DUF2334 domain-containing protein, partial [Comamonas sp.]